MRAWQAWRAHLVLLLGRLRVGGQQRRHHLDGSAIPQGELQRQPPILRSAAASE